jgi:2-keto-4-pentenoate hydratase
VQSLDGALQPKLEPEIVFKLAKTPAANASVEDIADCLEWMAHGLEIVVNPFNTPGNTTADAIAAFGMHGTLLIGEARMLSSASRQHLAEALSNASVSVSCGETMMGAGFGHNVLNSPVHAIWHLHQLLKAQPAFPPLQAGEIITTGSWTPAFPVRAGQTWVTAFSGVNVPGLSISFV